jgi:hypothetical protein
MEISSTFAASDGNEYEIQMGRWSRRLAEPFLDFTGTANDEEVLDVGCGTGNLAFAIAQRAKTKSITGATFRQPMSRMPKAAIPLPRSHLRSAMRPPCLTTTAVSIACFQCWSCFSSPMRKTRFWK